MDNNEFLKEQLDLIKKKQIDTSIEWQDVADFRSSHGKEPEHRDTIRKGSKLLLEYIDAGWDLFPSSSIQLGRFSDEIALKNVLNYRLKSRNLINGFVSILGMS